MKKKPTRGGKRPNAGRSKKFPGYDTTMVQTLCPVDFVRPLKELIDNYLDGLPKKNQHGKD